MESSNCSGELSTSSVSGSNSEHCYCLLNNIPDSFHTSDLRNFFSEYMDGEKFDMFHFRHRPQLFNASVENDKLREIPGSSTSTFKTPIIPKKKCCCIIRFSDNLTRNMFITRYHSKLWMDKDGNDLPSKCIISKVNLKAEDLKMFANKELHPPKFMPRGNVGTPNGYFLNLIRECRLPPSLIKKLGLEFPRARVFKRYSKVPPPPTLDKRRTKTKIVLQDDDEDEDDCEDDVKTGKGHILSDAYIPTTAKDSSQTDADTEKQRNSGNESEEDDDRCEEWERHEALHDHRTTHGDATSESKERLYEQEIELQWEKGGPGIVWYTDAQFWDQQRGGFDERTSDDWDVDMEGYYEPGAGDKDAQDLINMRRSERVRQGLETVSVIRKITPGDSSYRRKVRIQLGGNSNEKGKIGEFEKHTRGIGRKVMEKSGWKDGDGLGKTIKGIPDALDNEGQGPADKRGFGFYGEKIELGNQKKRRRDFKDYDIEAEDRIVIGTIYDKPEDLDIPDQLKRRNAPTFIKRYDFCKATVEPGDNQKRLPKNS